MTELSAAVLCAIAPSAAIPNDTVVPYYLRDRRVRIAIARVDGRLYAFDDLCPCTKPRCPLSGGLLARHTVMCQCHGSRFDIASGAVLDGPANDPLNVYEIQEIDGDIQIRL